MAYLGKTLPLTLHHNASFSLHIQARVLRKAETVAEKLLWKELKNRKCGGLKFRRQHPFSKFVLDFYCHEKALAIELDGGIHNDSYVREHDINRTFELENLGIKVIRFSNEEVYSNIDDVLMRIIVECDITSSPRPSPSGEGS